MKKTENFDFFDVNKTYRELFFQYPQVFIYGETYKKMSSDAKTAYMVFKNRLQYSIKNNWIDENNKIYFIFTNKELEKVLNVSKNTVTKIKKELEDFGLLLQVPQGFNIKKQRNNPHRLYLSNLEVTAQDVYLFKETAEKLDENGTNKNPFRQETNKIAESLGTNGIPKIGSRDETKKIAESLGTNGIPKIGSRDENAKDLDTSGIPKNDLYIYKELSTKDSKDYKDISQTDKTDSKLIDNSFNSKETNPELENILIDDYIEEKGFENLYGEQLIRRIKLVSYNDFDTFTDYMNKLEFAQKSVEQEEDIALPIYQGAKYFDDLEQQLLRTLTRTIQQHRFGKIKSIENYLFISFKNTYEDFANAIKEETSRQTP